MFPFLIFLLIIVFFIVKNFKNIKPIIREFIKSSWFGKFKIIKEILKSVFKKYWYVGLVYAAVRYCFS